MLTLRRRGWRNWARFTLGRQLALVLVLGVWLGWFARNARVEHEVVAAIERNGGDAYYDWQIRRGRADPQARPWAPKWLVDSMGIEYFGNVVEVYGTITDSELLQATRLRNLRSLVAMKWAVSSRGLACLEKLNQLEALIVDGSEFSDEDLVHVRGLARLADVWLAGTKVTNRGLVHLTGLTRMKRLLLDQIPVTDADLVHLKGMTGLEVLGLGRSRITDAGLRHLAGFVGLKRLSLHDTAVTDAGLVHLKVLRGLEWIDLSSTAVTHAGAGELKRALPSLAVVPSRLLAGAVDRPDVAPAAPNPSPQPPRPTTGDGRRLQTTEMDSERAARSASDAAQRKKP
jgi:hypothetical protein